MHPLQKAILVFAIGSTLWLAFESWMVYARQYNVCYAGATFIDECIGRAVGLGLSKFIPGEIIILTIAGVALYLVKAMKPKQ